MISSDRPQPSVQLTKVINRYPYTRKGGPRGTREKKLQKGDPMSL
jgi:hypothetical protein